MTSEIRPRNFEARYIAEGFRQDATILLEKFLSRNSYHFDDFRIIFKEMRFSLVYQGRHNASEMGLFTQEIFRIVLSLLESAPNRLCKTGILYLLYSLYVVQPIDKFPIRILLKEFDELLELVKFGHKEKHITIVLTFKALFDQNAFWAVHTERPMGVMAIPPVKEPLLPPSLSLQPMFAPYEPFDGTLRNHLDKEVNTTSSMFATYSKMKEKIDLKDIDGTSTKMEHVEYLEASRILENFLGNCNCSDVAVAVPLVESHSTPEIITPEIVDKTFKIDKVETGDGEIGVKRKSLKMRQFEASVPSERACCRRNGAFANKSPKDRREMKDRKVERPPALIQKTQRDTKEGIIGKKLEVRSTNS